MNWDVTSTLWISKRTVSTFACPIEQATKRVWAQSAAFLISCLHYGFNYWINYWAADSHFAVPVRVVWAVKGKDVDLPCDITTSSKYFIFFCRYFYVFSLEYRLSLVSFFRTKSFRGLSKIDIVVQRYHRHSLIQVNSFATSINTRFGYSEHLVRAQVSFLVKRMSMQTQAHSKPNWICRHRSATCFIAFLFPLYN